MEVQGGVVAPLIENENIVLYDSSWFSKPAGSVVDKTADRLEEGVERVFKPAAVPRGGVDKPVLPVKKQDKHAVGMVQAKVVAAPQFSPFLLRKMGGFLLALALTGLILSVVPLISAQAIRNVKTAKSFVAGLVNRVSSKVKKEPFLLAGQEEKEEDPNDFYLKIEKIGLESRVIPNVDASNSTEYKKALKEGLVHAKGTSLPGKNKMIYIFGHSTNYPWFIENINALFFKIETLEVNDEVVVDYNEKDYVYRVFDKKVIAAKNTDFVSADKDRDILVLQSCYPPGTYWKRMLIYCQPISVRSAVKKRITFGDLM